MPPTASRPEAPSPAIQFDFSAARSVSFATDTVPDEGFRVAAETEKAFLTLPFLYDATAGDVALSRASLKGKDAKGFYGFRVLAPKDGRPSPDDMQYPTVYERLELKIASPSEANGDVGKPTIIARNISGPRKASAEKTKSTTFKPASDRLDGTGFAVVILEIARSAKTISINLCGEEETIDIGFLKLAGGPISFPVGPDGQEPDLAEMPPAVVDVVERVTASSPAMAALAVDQLAANRRNWPRPETARWVSSVDATVLAACGRDSSLVQNAVWRYFSSGAMAGTPSPNLSASVLDFLLAADDALQMRTLRLIRCGLALEDCGVIWTRPGPREYLRESAQASGMAILATLLRSEDEGVCAEAVRALLRLDSSVIDWSALSRASATSQRLMIESLEKANDSPAISRLVRALFQSPQPANASALADLAERAHLRLGREDSRLVAGWDVKSPEDRAALFTALAGADVTQLLYSDQFATLLRDATLESTSDSEPDKAMRESAWEFILGQARRMLPGTPASQPTQARNKSRGGGSFPLLVSRTARDPMVTALGDAARRGPRSIRSQALVALLRDGYAEEAARALMDPATTAQQRELLLKELGARDGAIIGRDAFSAILGHLLRHECAANAPWILTRLDALKSKTPSDETWRMAASIKAGLNFRELDQLALSLHSPTSDSALSWLRDLGHMTPQDQQALAAAIRPDDRAAILNRIDLRRAQLVDGRYGALLVVETLPCDVPAAAEDAKETTPGTGRHWRAPQRVTLACPAVTITSNDEPDASGEQKLRVSWEGRPLGEGLVINKPKSVGGPGRFSPVLQVAAWNELSEGRLAGPSTNESAIGPVVLQHRAVANPPTPGTMNLEIAEYLRRALAAHKAFPAKEIDGLVPQSCPITLRYASFGSYYGCTPDLPQPDSSAPAPPHRLLCVMMVLEKMD